MTYFVPTASLEGHFYTPYCYHAGDFYEIDYLDAYHITNFLRSYQEDEERGIANDANTIRKNGVNMTFDLTFWTSSKEEKMDIYGIDYGVEDTYLYDAILEDLTKPKLTVIRGGKDK